MRLIIYGSNPWALVFIPHSGYERYPGLLNKLIGRHHINVRHSVDLKPQ